MNAAFAIGRLCDMEIGRKRLLSLPDSEAMVHFWLLLLFSWLEHVAFILKTSLSTSFLIISVQFLSFA